MVVDDVAALEFDAPLLVGSHACATKRRCFQKGKVRREPGIFLPSTVVSIQSGGRVDAGRRDRTPFVLRLMQESQQHAPSQ